MRIHAARMLRAVADRLAPPPPAPPVIQYPVPITWSMTSGACGVPTTVAYSWRTR